MARTRSGLVSRRVTRSVSATQPADASQTELEDEGQAVALRGGDSLSSDDETDDDDHHHYRRKRSRSRARNVVVRPRVPGLNKKPDYQPDGYGYKAVPKQDTHEAKMHLLGIDESLLEPLDGGGADDVVTRWFGPRRSLSELSEYGAADDVLRKLVGAGGLRRKWKPTQLRFKKPWPEGEIEDDDWFKFLFMDLDARVRNFAETHFGLLGRADDVNTGDVKTGGERIGPYLCLPQAWQGWVCDFVDQACSLWLPLSPQFCYYAAQVAKNDNKCADWERMLASGLHRPLLVRGVIMKALQASVFDKLLFGADKMAEHMLECHDELTIRLDGYQRTDLRSQLVRAILQGDTLPVSFWPQVDALTTRLTTLLLPLVELMDANFAASRARSLRKLYQDLHHIVAEAGYLSVAIRQSRTVFRFFSPNPGDPWDHDQTHPLDAAEVYDLSKEAGAEQDLATEKEWVKEQEKQRERRHAHTTGSHAARARKKGSSRTGTGTGAEHSIPQYHAPARLARAHIIMAPSLERFVPHEEMPEPEGHTKGTLAHARVAYYDGFADQQDEYAESYPTLHEYLSVCRWRAWTTPQRWVRAVWAWRRVAAASLAVLAVLFAVNATRFGVEQAKETIRDLLGDFKGLAKQPLRASREPWDDEELAFSWKVARSLNALAWTLFTSFLGAVALLLAVLMKPFSA